MANAREKTDLRGIRRQLNWSNLGPDAPFLATLLEDPRFLEAAEQILGGDVIGMYANGNCFASDRTEWHPDTSYLDRHGVKFAFYLQPLEGDTGAIRFIPGSHKAPLHTDIRRLSIKESNKGVVDQHGLNVDEMPAFVASSIPGDVIAFDNRVWHASWGGGQERKMCSVGYFAAPTADQDEAIVRERAEQEAQLIESFPLVKRPAIGSPIPRTARCGRSGSTFSRNTISPDSRTNEYHRHRAHEKAAGLIPPPCASAGS